jgi:hypothetical protein
LSRELWWHFGKVLFSSFHDISQASPLDIQRDKTHSEPSPVSREDEEPERVYAGQCSQPKLLSYRVKHCPRTGDTIFCLETYPLLWGEGPSR